jgi:hypothetical protein
MLLQQVLEFPRAPLRIRRAQTFGTPNCQHGLYRLKSFNHKVLVQLSLKALDCLLPDSKISYYMFHYVIIPPLF